MKIRYLYQGGKKRCLTMSYDDCPPEDIRLVELFNKYHIKGTFHLISNKLRDTYCITPEQVKTVYAGHEVSCHSLTHPFFDQIPKEELMYEMLEDKRNLEAMCGYPVRGMSYPNGIITEDVLTCLKACGFVYARTAASSENFKLPQDFMQWTGTCHHSHDIISKIEQFRSSYYAANASPLFYIWGHSFEFPRNTENNSWAMIEEFCDKFTATFEDSVWYATNIEIYDYITAQRSLSFSVDRTMVYNGAAISVWLDVDGQPVEVKPGVKHLV
ncbi:MAG: polysaccharide deacetylase family protein [Clostridia bacterium]|nr:polysaccharide deacetylase family protein [Clostridia bacterium]